MLMLLFDIPLALLSFLLVYLLYRVIRATPNLQKVPDKSPGVSIVIPFCNEAPNLPGLLSSLNKQSYPGPVQIILINDRSTDEFSSVIHTFQKRLRHDFMVVDSPFDPSLALSSKQQALEYGVSLAVHDYIAFTDADMELLPDWLTSLATQTARGFDLVIGHTVIAPANSLFEKLQAAQLEFLFSAVYAFGISNMRGSCMGNNILFRKNLYRQIGGQQGIGYTITEDLALYDSFVKHGFNVGLALPFFPTACTKPCQTMRSFVDQALRWAKGGMCRSSALLPIAALVSIQNLICIVALAGFAAPLLKWHSGANLLLLLLFTASVKQKTKSPGSILFFPVFYLFFLIETLLLGPLTILPVSLSWKGQKLSLRKRKLPKS